METAVKNTPANQNRNIYSRIKVNKQKKFCNV
jgi:hypothetical protein